MRIARHLVHIVHSHKFDSDIIILTLENTQKQLFDMPESGRKSVYIWVGGFEKQEGTKTKTKIYGAVQR